MVSDSAFYAALALVAAFLFFGNIALLMGILLQRVQRIRRTGEPVRMLFSRNIVPLPSKG